MGKKYLTYEHLELRGQSWNGLYLYLKGLLYIYIISHFKMTEIRMHDTETLFKYCVTTFYHNQQPVSQCCLFSYSDSVSAV